MKVSLGGLMRTVEASLRSSRDSHACMNAYVLLELGDNLRLLAEGSCTVDEFFALYTISRDDKQVWADLVEQDNYAIFSDASEDAE